jgi:serine/threonine-protein kinase
LRESNHVGPYQIVQQLGAGGMGEVHLAIDTRLNRKVALKTLAPGSIDPAGRARLLHEARSAAALNHPNIAAIYDVVETGDRTHIVMEYVEGVSLSARLASGPLPAAVALDVVAQLADALVAAHAAGIVHRDLKPGNVILTPDGKAKVLDFGIARVLPAATGSTKPFASSPTGPTTEVGQVVGTPGYTSPEQLVGRPADHRSDIYALGVVLYQSITGRHPFGASDTAGAAIAALTEDPPAPHTLRSDVPERVSRIALRAMARVPDARYQTALELRNDLLRAAAVLREATTGTLPAAMPARRLRRAALVAGVIAVIVAAGLWTLPDLRSRLTPAAPSPTGTPILAVLPLANLGGDASREYVSAAMTESLVTNLARLPAVTVVSPSATLEARRRRDDAATIARDLGVTYLVDGAVQHAGDEVRVTLRLVRADGSLAWGGEFDGTMAGLFPLQRRLAEGVSDALQVRFSDAERRRLDMPPTANAAVLADYWRGRALLERPDVKANISSAIAIFERVTRDEPRFALGYAGLAEAYWRQFGETRDPAWTTRAIEASQEALRLDPDQPLVRIALANVYHATGRSETAAEELRRVIAAQPNNDEAHSLLGNVLTDLGKDDEAIIELTRAIAIRPNFWQHHGRLGFVYYKTGRFAEAVEEFGRVTERQPDNASGFQMLGTAYHAQGDTARALANYQRAIQITPSVNAYSNMGAIHQQEGRFAEAAAAFEKAIELRPREPHHHRNLGVAYEQLSRRREARAAYARARDLYEQLRRVNPRDAGVVAALAICEVKLGHHRAAERHLEEALALAPRDAEVRYRAAAVHALTGRPTQALDELDRALSLGASPSVARVEPDFSSLRGLPEFKALLARKR